MNPLPWPLGELGKSGPREEAIRLQDFFASLLFEENYRFLNESWAFSVGQVYILCLIMPFKCPHQQNFMFWSDMKHEIGRQPNQIWSKPTFFPRNDVWGMILMIPIRSLVPDVGIGTSLVWIFLENPVPEMSQAVYGGLSSVVWDLGFALFDGWDPDFCERGEK